MIFYGVSRFSFLLGIAFTLLVLDVALLIVYAVLKRKVKKMEEELDGKEDA